MSVDKNISRAIVEKELSECYELFNRFGVKLLSDNADSLTFSLEIRSRIDNEIYWLEVQYDNYKEQPLFIEFIEPGTDIRGTLNAYPKSNDSFFHNMPCICNPCSRKAYKQNNGPHGDWTLAGWLKNQKLGSLSNLHAILNAIISRINNKEKYLGRMQPFPNDILKYIIPREALRKTEEVLNYYSRIDDGNESLVYWGGIKTKNEIIISLVMVPDLITEAQRVTITPTANIGFIQALSQHGCVHIAQVHSHPTEWIDHSYGDDQFASFKHNGLVSIVVPSYCNDGMLPLIKNGIHRYSGKSFIRLSNKYVNEHFLISDEFGMNFVDSRK